MCDHMWQYTVTSLSHLSHHVTNVTLWQKWFASHMAEPLLPMAQPLSHMPQPSSPMAQPFSPMAQPFWPMAQPLSHMAQPLWPMAQPFWKWLGHFLENSAKWRFELWTPQGAFSPAQPLPAILSHSWHGTAIVWHGSANYHLAGGGTSHGWAKMAGPMADPTSKGGGWAKFIPLQRGFSHVTEVHQLAPPFFMSWLEHHTEHQGWMSRVYKDEVEDIL